MLMDEDVESVDTASRLLRLLSLLQSRPRWSGPELAQRLDVTGRCVRRDVARLRRLGYPVDSEAGPAGGYRLGMGATLPPLLFDDDEAVAVWLALAASTGGAVEGMQERALGALDKIDRLLPGRLRQRVDALRAATVRLGSSPTDLVDPELLVRLARACTERLRLALSYVDRQERASDRRVDPYKLVSTGRRWYLVAHDVDRADWRTFRVDRVVEAVITGHRFELVDPPDAAALVAASTSIAPYRFAATVLIDADLETVRRRVPANVAVLEATGVHRTRMRTGADNLATLAGHLILVDLPFEVLDPPELRDWLVIHGRQLAAAHDDAPPRPAPGGR